MSAPLPYFTPPFLPQHSGAAAPLGLSHRGFSPAGLENTMAAFQAAVDLGFGYLETDVRTTSDGVLMAFHDETLDRVTDGSGPISARSLRELRGVRVGGTEPIPTLEEVLVRWPDVRLNVDIKDAAGAGALAALIEKHQAHDRVLVTSFSDRRRLDCLRRLSRPAASSAGSGGTAAMLLLSPLGLGGLVARLGRFGCVQVPLNFRGIPVVRPAFLRRCHRAGIQVHVWTVNTRPLMEGLLDLGVDGLVSDRADLLSQVLSARGAWPQGSGSA
ncbi:glycerophosphodiester phosphodiesterase [Arthrobacter sp. zg-Y916]|uniref:Glycerophosphodiester phosphodiesterase n=1 Tax=Arthrobacter caoxuetaonis TaxID=2886935 RepID=A0A9X1SDE0_9MICC|nr:glycerophosphodiester phosphodiesterase family protein [Arthrobacter caoxuetaonis]MCC3298616.1 glycerophosphodiester phosphodiesterase [Arthrobacter caoxuetaonis]MCC9194843.1 glycerophosphodiester phosphodiesterase [Arthrobacter sp. zg-Y916]USQ57357.1 glycerophosphodiester phosphodiesterase [Arthrobacter caoxuetaonis]